MELPIENRYRMDRARWLALHGRSDVRFDASGFGWIGLLLFSTACTVLMAIGTQPAYLLIFLPIGLFCGYRIFLQSRVLADRDFRALAARRGAESWEVAVVFSDAVLVSDGGDAAVHPWSHVRALASDRAGWFLLLSDGGEIRLDPAGFAPGGAADFLAFLAERHPEVAVARLRTST
jgi:hypothetical protein